MKRITIVGTGPVGVSIGLALMRARPSDTEVVGTSEDRNALSATANIGAMDQAISNLSSAVQGAHLVILDTPLTEARELLDALGPNLDHGCVVTDTGAAKVRVMEWANQYLPRGISFVGGHPLHKKALLSLEDADPALFEGVDYCVMPGHSADQGSVRTVVSLVERLGAKPLFLDPHEHDSYVAAMSHLPVVLSSAFVTTTGGSDAWREMQRLAASEFADFSRFASCDPLDNEVACRANPEALVHWIDETIKVLYSYRNQIKDGSDELQDTFVKAWEARARWKADAVVEDNSPRLPTAGESMATVFFGGHLMGRYRQMRGEEKKKKSWRYFGRDRAPQ